MNRLGIKEEWKTMTDIEVSGDANIDWMYPSIYAEDGPRNFLRIGLMHVRAANDIEIEYDSDRDGWLIFQIITTGFKLVESEKGNYYEPIEDRREMAFIPAWAEDEVSEP
jgi:hypothetical protein